jgi:hypothetical protein
MLTLLKWSLLRLLSEAESKLSLLAGILSSLRITQSEDRLESDLAAGIFVQFTSLKWSMGECWTEARLESDITTGIPLHLLVTKRTKLKSLVTWKIAIAPLARLWYSQKCHPGAWLGSPRNSNWRGKLSAVDLHIKVACFVKNV